MSNRAMGAETKWRYSGIGHQSRDGVEQNDNGSREKFSWQDDSLCQLEHYRAPDTSTILLPGYKFKHFSRARVMASGNKMKSLYSGITSLWRYNALLKF
jgi:hypothetical protein